MSIFHLPLIDLGMKRRTWGDSWLCVSMCAILSAVTRVKRKQNKGISYFNRPLLFLTSKSVLSLAICSIFSHPNTLFVLVTSHIPSMFQSIFSRLHGFIKTHVPASRFHCCQITFCLFRLFESASMLPAQLGPGGKLSLFSDICVTSMKCTEPMNTHTHSTAQNLIWFHVASSCCEFPLKFVVQHVQVPVEADFFTADHLLSCPLLPLTSFKPNI